MTICVVGDYIKDRYIQGDSHRFAPEAPHVPIISDPVIKLFNGGAYNVYNNVKALTSDCVFFTNYANVCRKTRILHGNELVARYDDDSYSTNWDMSQKLPYETYGMLVLSDYNKGAIHNPKDYITAASKVGIKTLVDPKKPFKEYKGATLVKANIHEFREELGINASSPINWWSDSDAICRAYNFQHLIITMGSGGAFLYMSDEVRNRTSSHQIGLSRHYMPVDVTGAGDVFMAVLAYYTWRGFGLLRACKIATDLASRSTEFIGPYVITRDDRTTAEGYHQ